MTDREKAKREYLGGKSLKDIASELRVKDSTVRAWKLRDGWPKVQRKRATKKKSVAIQKNVAEMPLLPMSESEDLNPQERLFCEIYDRNHNATQAYIKAYSSSYQTAHSHAYELVARRGVKAYLEKLRQQRKEAYNLEPFDIVERMMEIAFANIGDYVYFGQKEVQVMTSFGPLYEKGKDGEQGTPVMKIVNFVDIKDSAEVDTSLIEEISQGKDGVKVKLADRMKALEWLGKYFMMNPMDKHRVEYDSKKQELDRLEYERRKKKDESEDF